MTGTVKLFLDHSSERTVGEQFVTRASNEPERRIASSNTIKCYTFICFDF